MKVVAEPASWSAVELIVHTFFEKLPHNVGQPVQAIFAFAKYAKHLHNLVDEPFLSVVAVVSSTRE